MKRILTMSVLAMVAVTGSATAGPVTTNDLLNAQDNAKEWLTYGRDYRNWRYSPLTEITPETASKLSPVWAMSTGGQFGGLEATPLFRDGVLYLHRRLRPHLRRRREVRQYPLALRAGVWGWLQRRPVLRAYPPRSGAHGRSRDRCAA